MGKLLEALMQPFTCIAQLLIMLFICARFRHVGDDQISYLSGLFMREWSVPAKVLQAAVAHVVRCFSVCSLSVGHWMEELSGVLRASGHPELQLYCKLVTCYRCGSRLPDKPHNFSRASVYSRQDGRRTAEVCTFQCRKCRALHYPSYCVVAGGDRFFYPAKSSQFFMASKESAFEICMLLEVEAHMHYNHASYNGLTKVFDRMCDTSERPGRLDRRCLTEAHLRWVLVGHLEGTGALSISPQGGPDDLDRDIKRHMDTYIMEFQQRWARHHHCSKPGCRKVAGADGHMKARRCVCANSKKRTVSTIPGLNCPTVLVACTASPAPNSRFCADCQKAAAADVEMGVNDESREDQEGREDSEPLSSCNTVKDKGKILNATSAGVLAVAWSCGIVIGLSELYGAESLTQVYAALITLWDVIQYIPPYFFYDDGCHLSRFMTNPKRMCASDVCHCFAATQVCVDRVHFKNHTDRWCKQHMDPDSIPEMMGVNTEACEQLFSWMSGFKSIVRHMNQSRFIFFLLRMCHLHNEDLERRMQEQKVLIQSGTAADVRQAPHQEVKYSTDGSPLYLLACSKQLPKA